MGDGWRGECVEGVRERGFFPRFGRVQKNPFEICGFVARGVFFLSLSKKNPPQRSNQEI